MSEDRAEQRILRAALAAFAEFGYGGASTREIARRAGVHQPAIAYHFGSKEDLWRAAVDAIFTELSTALRAATEGAADPAERARRLVSAFVRFVAHRPEWFAFQQSESLNASERTAWLSETYYAPLVRLMHEELTSTPWPPADLPASASMIGILVGSTAMFVQRAQLLQISSVDARSPAFIETHVRSVYTAVAAVLADHAA